MSDPRPLAESDDEIWRGLRAVLTDIDDTITVDGRVPSGVFDAMERLRDAGLLVVPVTGRPAGWCDLVARQWPVDAVVGENGAFYFRYDSAARRMIRVYADSEATLHENRARLDRIRDEVLASVPGSAVAADQPFRLADLAIDFCEDVTPLAEGEVARIVEIFEQHGATAKVSSIHVNGWYGNHDKLSMTRRLFTEQFSLDIDSSGDTIAFAGDSPNDAPMFGFFKNGVGVANIRDQLHLCNFAPAWICFNERADGFIELAERILSVR